MLATTAAFRRGWDDGSCRSFEVPSTQRASFCDTKAHIGGAVATSGLRDDLGSVPADGPHHGDGEEASADQFNGGVAYTGLMSAGLVSSSDTTLLALASTAGLPGLGMGSTALAQHVVEASKTRDRPAIARSTAKLTFLVFKPVGI